EAHADETARLRVPLLLGAQVERRGPVPRRGNPEGRPGQGAHVRPGSDRCRRRGDLHRLNPVQRATDPEGSGGRRGRHGSHDPKPVQGAHGEARHQGRTVAASSFPRKVQRSRTTARTPTVHPIKPETTYTISKAGTA